MEKLKTKIKSLYTQFLYELKTNEVLNKQYSIGIRPYLASGIVILTISAIGFIGIFTLKFVETNAVYRKIKEAEVVGRFIQSISEKSSAKDRRVLFEKAFQSGDIHDATVIEGNDIKIFTKGSLPPEGGTLLLFQDGIKIRQVGGGFLDVGEYLYVTVSLNPNILSKGKAVYTVNLADVEGYMDEVRGFIGIYAIVDSLIVIMVAVYFLSKTVVWPLRKLESAAVRISKGNFSERVDVSDKNELGTLAEAFNVMAERLEEEINRLERVNKELVDTQDELLRASTLAAVGRLSAGIAHELGNPLGAVLGYLEILSKDIDDKDLGEDDKKDILVRTEKEIQRVNTIVSEFLSMLREPSVPPAPIDINEVVLEVVESMESSKGFSSVKAVVDTAEGLHKVSIDPSKLKQVMVNLFVNSADAIGRDGEVEIKTFEEMVERHGIDGEEEGEKLYVAVVFRDEGSGISEDDAPMIFEPFYTTKEVGKGTGLGLYVSSTIVKTFGGMIEFESKEGQFTEFKILLPAVESGSQS